MKILLDTQAFLWLIADDKQLSKKAKTIFLNKDNELFLSLASMWELAIKLSIKKIILHEPLEQFIPNQLQKNYIQQLDINFRHVTKVATLPFHHRDPFDRLLVSQGIIEHMPILSCDSQLDSYSIKRIW